MRAWGAHPIGAPRSHDDAVDMTVLAIRDPSCDQQQDALESTANRFGRTARAARVSNPMPDSGKTKVEDIRARLEQGTYIVDAEKVAAAIVARLLAGGSVRETGGRAGS
jgi:anti-sigma28 factor (negative regulator of flagellin synthesis)